MFYFFLLNGDLKMDMKILITGIFLTALFVVPILYVALREKNKGKYVLKTFTKLAKESGVEIQSSDSWNNNYCIGTDVASIQLVYWNRREFLPSPLVIPISNIESAKIYDSTKSSKSNGNTPVPANSKVELVIRMKNKDENRLLFFDATRDSDLVQNIQLAEKWLGIIESKQA
jgi:hypothetical protein